MLAQDNNFLNCKDAEVDNFLVYRPNINQQMIDKNIAIIKPTYHYLYVYYIIRENIIEPAITTVP